MKRNRFWGLLLCFTLIAGLLSGCGSSAPKEAYDYALEEETSAAMSPESAMEGSGVTSGTGLSGYTAPNEKLIRTVHLDAETQEYDTLITSLEEKITSLEGYIENRDAYNGSEYSGRDRRYCSMVVRIPADRLNEFVTHVNENANVTNTTEEVENITLQYVDTASRVEALETEQERLLELLESAENLTDILEIEERLSDVRYELSSYASQLRVYDNQVSYATVYLNIDEVQKLTPMEEPTVWERISEGFGETIEDIAESAVDFFVWFVVNSPRILIFAAVVTVFVLIVKVIKRRGKRKKATAAEPPKDTGTD